MPFRNLRLAARSLRRNPAFTATALLCLGIGIGANTAVFSLVNALLLRPPAVRDAARVMRFYPGGERASYPAFQFFRDYNDVFSGLAAETTVELNFSRGQEPERVFGALVSANYFSVLGVEAALGRTFLPHENSAPGAHPVAVLSHRFWQNAFGGDGGVVGSPLILNNQRLTIVGVAAEEFVGSSALMTPQVWIPAMMQPQVWPGPDRLSGISLPSFYLIGRLEAGIQRTQALASLQALYLQFGDEWGFEARADQVALIAASALPLPPPMQTPVYGVFGLLMAFVGLIPLIACSNVANLLLARAARRRGEIALRLALGAGRRRIVRLLLTESLLLGGLAGLLGLALGASAASLLRTATSALPIPIALDVNPDWRVFAFTMAVALLTGILFGLAPVLRLSNPDLNRDLKNEQGGRPLPALRKLGLRNLLPAFQVALSLTLLIAAGLLLRSLLGAKSIDPGFRIQDGLVASLDLASAGYGEEEGRRYYERLIEQAEALPEVRSACLAQLAPLGLLSNIRSPAAADGKPAVEIYLNRVGSGYFETLGIPLLRGRGLTPQDGPNSPRVAVINQTLSERFWPGQDPLGKSIVLGGRRALQVVGVVRDSKYERLGEAPRPFLFESWRQRYNPRLNLHIRVASSPSALIPSVQDMIRSLDKGVIFQVTTLEESISLVFLLPRILAGVFALFGLTGLAMSLVGVAGLVAFEVSRRTREIGIRMALGSTPSGILRMVVGQGMQTALAGILLGALASAGLSQFLSGFLYQVSPTDPWTFGLAAVLLALAVLMACCLPARRAARVDPIKALRCQ